ncbi:hypothetical protein ODS41_06340 [Pyrobaculum sp. 3827-6]|uniref:hypothetical protein n=1 Tax=Pyrobaculum sp. 3827-6 TaxID=2983604 RepID=UPI0021DA1DCF|nr:hypothetical protein [Pyrobaculum sp. 3827-6]MCU7787534.1 hypothetical protein [Pyrobaculum sp. 3827-6]
MINATLIAIALLFPGNASYALPNSSLIGFATVTSYADSPLSCALSLSTYGCSARPSESLFKLYAKGDSRTFVFNLTLGSGSCRLIAKATCGGATATAERVITPRVARAEVELIAPSTLTCHFDPKYQPYTFVVASYMPAFVKFLTGRDVGHPDLLGVVCVRANGTYTALLVMTDPSGRRIPIAAQSLYFNPETEFGTIIVPVRGAAVFPIFVPGEAEKFAGGVYNLTVFLYPPGSPRPVYNKTYTIKVISVRGESLLLAIFSVFVALPFFAYAVGRYVRENGLKEILLPMLFAPLSFVVVTVPGALMRGLGSFLGPFDWVTHGFFYGTLQYFLYTVLISLRPKLGALSLAFLGSLLLSMLYFGFGIMLFLWTATSSLFFETFLYAAGVTRGESQRPWALAVSLTSASAVDRYIDFILYASFYRLYYADWYLATYIAGMAAYSLAGILMGLRLCKYVRAVYYE